jgi:hypothetical protein
LEIAEGGACRQAHPSDDWLGWRRQGKHSKYWFAFHPHQKETIAKYPQGYVAFGCGSAELIVFIPAKEFVGWLERFWTTELEDRFYWHVRIVGDKAKLTMDTKAGFTPIDVTQYLVTN